MQRQVRRFIAVCALATVVVASAGAQLAAQAGAQVPAPAARRAAAGDSARTGQRLFTPLDAGLALGFTGLTVAALSADESMAQRMQRHRARASSSVNSAATAFNQLGSPGVIIAGVGTYALGRVRGDTGLADIGWHMTEALIIGGAMTDLIKGLTGRTRPWVSADSNSGDFSAGGGFTADGRQSFPSGHTTVAFAAAAAVTGEVGRRWPRYQWVAGPLLYGSAAAVGLARMYKDQHWASDVVAGAGIGTFAGLMTVRYAHLHPDNVVDRFMLHTSIAPDGQGGARLTWSMPIR